ncbi:MAG: RluA family pseudouridine synthase [Flavobacteriales bacterium]|nr:RluA family pseudouridine synthase [Flavobacteriales bacterium]
MHHDAVLCAVWKPAGIPVLPDRTGDPDLRTMVRARPGHDRVEPPHRIDRPVSGVVLFALDAPTLAALNQAFRAGRVRKTYWAIVEGRPGQELVVAHRLVHDPRGHRARAAADGRPVRLTATPIAQGDRYTLMEVVPEGGAFHQVRAQLALAGFPIKGDVKYGARRGEADRSIALHARSVSLRHPATGAELVVVAPPPEGRLWQALAPDRPTDRPGPPAG